MAILKLLEQLHLPPREAKVYVELLKLGLTAVGPIVSKTKMHRMLVYQALEKLKDQRLASVVLKNGKQHWQAANPSLILENAKKQTDIARAAVLQLEALRQDAKEEVSVQILYGVSGLKDHLLEAIDSAARTDKVIRIIGGASDVVFYNLLGKWYETYAKIASQKRVKKKLIAHRRYSEAFETHFKKEPGTEYKFAKGELSTPTFTRITPEYVGIEIYGGKEPVVIQIKNKAIAQAYIEKFELLYKESKSS